MGNIFPSVVLLKSPEENSSNPQLSKGRSLLPIFDKAVKEIMVQQVEMKPPLGR